MGTPIRLEDITGGLTDAPPLTIERAKRLGMGALAACKPQLKYLGGWKQFGDHLNDGRTAENTRLGVHHERFPNRIYPTPEGFNGVTRCFLLAVPIYKTWKRGRQTCVYRQTIILSDDGSLLVWDWFAQRLRPRGEPMTEFAIRSKVRRISPAKMKRIFSNVTSCLLIVKALQDLLASTLERQRNQIKAMERIEDDIVRLAMQ